ncbi:MAG: mandelate racemase/muconate lactonizing enzyme family protein [Burkholderiaceae bacterium]
MIDSIELHLVQAPLPAPFSPSWIINGTRQSLYFYLVRLRTDDGVEGFSAFSATSRERAGMGDSLAALLLGKDIHDQAHLMEMLRIPAYGGFRNFWVEPAFWDIRGKLAGKPVYELLGGKAQTVDLYASAGEVKEPAARIEEALARHEEGFRVMKIRVHDFDEKVDIRQMQEPAAALQGKMKLAVDCNQAFWYTGGGAGPKWDLPRAKRFCDAAFDAGMLWVEEPLFMDWHDQMAELTAYSRVPISGGELHTGGLLELATMIEKKCYSIYQPDAMWTGGIEQTLEIARLVRKAGAQFTPHTWSNGIGFAVNFNILLASGFAGEHELEYPINPPGWTVEARDALLVEPWQHDRGTLAAPTRPGLGFEIDEKALARYGRCFFKADRKTVSWMPEALSTLPMFASPR